MYRSLCLLLLLLCAALLFASAPAQAATISVACSTTSLIDAIISANNSAANDVLNLEASCTYTLTEIHNATGGLGGNGLPAIASAATSGTLTINGNNVLIVRVGGEAAPKFRFFYLLSGANLTIKQLTLVNGSIDNYQAGGIYNNGGTLTLQNSTITGNNGGGLYNTGGGNITINRTAITDSVYGTGFSNVSGNVTMSDSTILGNYAEIGGFANYGEGTVTITNSTITGNNGSYYGGGFYNSGTVTLIHTTVANNGTPQGWATFYNVGTLTLYNSLLVSHEYYNNCVNYVPGVINGSYNLFNELCTGDGTSNLTNTLVAEPALGALTGSPAYLPLTNLSPAIDSGSNALAAGLTYDQRGPDHARIYNGTVDIGAIERQPAKIRINNVTETEGPGDYKVAVFDVTLSSPAEYTVNVNYALSNGTAISGSDYTIPPENGLIFLPGQTLKYIYVTLLPDTMYEPHETFNVTLSNATNAVIADNLGVGMIVNDDSRPVIRVNDLARTEGGSGVQTNLPFTVSLSNPSYQTITVQFATSDGTATTADGDYTPLSLTTLTFSPGQSSRNVTVKITGDAKHEPHETLNFNLSNPTNASIVDTQGIGTIANDDSKPSIAVNNVSRLEGNSGTTNFAFVVALSHPSYQTITVNFATSNGTAAAGTDYTARSGSLSFAPGVTSRTVTVLGNGDTLVEPNETFNFNLSTPVNATLADALGVGTITNDDAAGLSEEGVQIVPVAPELPQFLPVAPVMPDAPSVELPGVMLVSPVRETSENPVAFTWIGTMDAAEYRVLVQTQADRAVMIDVTVSAATCNGNICVLVSQFAPQAGVGYVWTVTPITANGAGMPSAEAGFSYNPSAPDGIELPGTVIGG